MSRDFPESTSRRALSLADGESRALGVHAVRTINCPRTTCRFVNRNQSPQPVCWLGGLGVVSRGKINCQFHFLDGGLSSTMSGRTSTAFLMSMCLRSNPVIEYSPVID